jgi:ABC-type transport system involved in multi-copper enzyme maturation permease subunit
MKRLLSIELQKIFKNKASKVLTISYFVILSLIALLASIEFNIGPVHIQLAEQGIFNFPFIWHFNTYIAVYFKLFLAVIIVSMMANEYSNGTLKQNLIDGLSKKEFVLSKFVTIILFAAVSVVFIFVVSLILGLIFSSYNEVSIIFSQLEYLLAYFLNLVAFFSLCLFVGILVKRSAFALGFLMIWFIIESIFSSYLNYEVYRDSDTDKMFTQFLPFESISNLLIEPFSRLNAVKTIGSKVGVDYIKDYDVHWQGILIVLIWIFLYIYGSYYILKKRDL